MKIIILVCCVFAGISLLAVFEDFETTTSGSTTPYSAVLNAPHGLVIHKTTPATTALVLLESSRKKTCECAVFKRRYPSQFIAPILKCSVMRVKCDDNGHRKCLQLCATLARVSKYYGPQLLCAFLGNYNQFMVFVHSRICGANDWTYTGLSLFTDLCCYKHQIVNCRKEEHSEI